MSFFALRGHYWAFVAILCLVFFPREFNSLKFLGGALLWLWAAWLRVQVRLSIGEHSRLNVLTVPELLTEGWFAWSRNPLYLSNLLMVSGCLLLGGWSYWIIIVMMVLSILFYYKVVDEEEKYLEKEFGLAFANYKLKAPKWFSFALPKVDFKWSWPVVRKDFWTWFWQAIFFVALWVVP